MTNCEELEVRIDDYVDGLLGDDDRRRVEAHLATCPGCQETASALRDVLDRASALPPAVAPERDLWPGIAARVEHLERSRRSRRPFLLAAAAVLVVGAFVAGYAVRITSVPAPAPSAAVAPATPPAAVPARETPAPSSAELALLDAKRQLRAALEESRATLSPRTGALVDENLVLIEQAIDEIRVALAQDPGNRSLQRMLIATHVREIELLERVTGRTKRL